MHSNAYSANTSTAGEKINQVRAGVRIFVTGKKWLCRANNQSDGHTMGQE